MDTAKNRRKKLARLLTPICALAHSVVRLPRVVHAYLQPFSPNDDVVVERAALTACFAPAIDLQVHEVSTSADSGSNGVVSPPQLRTKLAEFKSRSGILSPWVHVFFARGLEGKRPFGVMYDAVGGGSRVEREGCAVFTPRIHVFDDGERRLLTRTLAHEIGHVLNLGHEDGEPPSIMAAGLPDEFTLSFSPNCLDHLASHDVDYVLPGSARKGFGELCPGVETHPPREGVDLIESSSQSVSLSLEVWSSDRTWSSRAADLRFGEPLLARTTIRNRRSRAVYFEASRRSDARVWIEIRGADGGWRRQTKASRTCTFERARVAPKRAAHQHHFLIHRRGRYVFPRVGSHAVRAVVALEGRRLASRPVEVTLRSARRGDERAWLELALDPALALFLEGETDVARVEAKLSRLVELCPRGHPLRDAAHLAAARRTAHAIASRVRVRCSPRAMRALEGSGVAQGWVRSEIRMERARVLKRAGDAARAMHLYAAVSRDDACDAGTRRRAAEELEETCE